MFTSFQRLFHQLFWMFVCVSKRHREVKIPLHDDLRKVMDKKHPSEIFWSSQQFWKSWNLTFPLWAWPWKFQLVVILRNFQNPYDYHKFWTEMSTSEVVTSMIHKIICIKEANRGEIVLKTPTWIYEISADFHCVYSEECAILYYHM